MYRVDRRSFGKNEIILPPPSSYQEQEGFDIDKMRLEKILSDERPDDKKNANRKSGLYIFAELSDAIRFCQRMSNSKIYQVLPHDGTICYHRGDMIWTEVMNDFRNNEDILRELAGFYWSGKMTFKPCMEMLVNEITVTTVLVNDNETRMRVCNEFNSNSTMGNVEHMQFYLEKLNQILLIQ